MTNQTLYTHKYPQATIAEGAIIHETCRIDPGCEISPEAILKMRVVLCQNVTIIGKVTLDPYVNIRENVTLVGPLHIGEGTYIAHDAVIGLLREDDALAEQETIIESSCRIGVGAEIIGGVHIGRHVWIRVGSKVIGDVPHYGLVSRNPAILEYYACPECGGVLQVFKSFREIVDTRCQVCGSGAYRFGKHTIFANSGRLLLPNNTFGEKVSMQGDNTRWIDEKELD